ncbi:hypothetical protein [Streptomyces griseocarneus]|uniref:hypothetical protein n=1 Tax=Streptomyces griseocarneus TaxID=51201 RepID=UPI00167D015F|nr:hypothetical protein [Streptomyces griseocarneus]MBZ6477704.1 DUF11 domain-containing protein [Streptomyces griseocarneus]
MKRSLRLVAAAALVAAAGLAPTAAEAAGTATARADYQAVAHPVTGRVGETVDVELGVRKAGPGRALADRAYEVTAPEGTTIVSAAACTPGEGNARTYLCALGADFPADDLETLSFQVRIDEKIDGAEGWVRVVDRDEEPDPDADPGNDSAPILVDVKDSGTPYRATGGRVASGTLLIAATSGTALSAGAIALGAARRREP